MLGVSVAFSEAEVHWRAFLESLVARGLQGVEFITSDDHSGLKAARKAVLPGTRWQRCQFHLAQNAIHHAPNQAIRKAIGEELRAVWDASSLGSEEEELKRLVAKYRTAALKLAWRIDLLDLCAIGIAAPSQAALIVARSQKLVAFQPHGRVHERGHDLRHGLWTFCHELFHDCGNRRIVTGHRCFLPGGWNTDARFASVPHAWGTEASTASSPCGASEGISRHQVTRTPPSVSQVSQQ